MDQLSQLPSDLSLIILHYANIPCNHEPYGYFKNDQSRTIHRVFSLSCDYDEIAYSLKFGMCISGIKTFHFKSTKEPISIPKKIIQTVKHHPEVRVLCRMNQTISNTNYRIYEKEIDNLERYDFQMGGNRIKVEWNLQTFMTNKEILYEILGNIVRCRLNSTIKILVHLFNNIEPTSLNALETLFKKCRGYMRGRLELYLAFEDSESVSVTSKTLGQKVFGMTSFWEECGNNVKSLRWDETHYMHAQLQIVNVVPYMNHLDNLIVWSTGADKILARLTRIPYKLTIAKHQTFANVPQHMNEDALIALVEKFGKGVHPQVSVTVTPRVVINYDRLDQVLQVFEQADDNGQGLQTFLFYRGVFVTANLHSYSEEAVIEQQQDVTGKLIGRPVNLKALRYLLEEKKSLRESFEQQLLSKFQKMNL